MAAPIGLRDIPTFIANGLARLSDLHLIPVRCCVGNDTIFVEANNTATVAGKRIVWPATPERVVAQMRVREEFCTIPVVAHGGVLMALADTLGGYATALNLSAGHTTATIESKTNFFAPAPAGSTVTAECVAVHRGKRTMVWQTRVNSEQGRLLALVTQTQLVLAPSKD
ncbi:MAG: PaaI family thioesterase [Deltaproteobacteria bacterium]|nr:PaaI family thioesterase [Deltaproteobacteria bacterium]